MRSAESAMGVSGFLISCATRRATSCQAAAFCARSSSLVSSSTIHEAGGQLLFERRDGDRQVRVWRSPVRSSIWREAAPVRRARFIRYLISAVSSRENRSSRRVARGHLLRRKDLGAARG